MYKALCTILAALALQLTFSPASSFADDHKGSGQIKVLLVDGQNNHDWKRCSPVMIDTLKATGRFSIERATISKAEVAAFNPDFKKYDVVLSNYNGASWTKKTEESFVKYIKGGGNLVVVHAADNSFPKWKEFNEMIGLEDGEAVTRRTGPTSLERRQDRTGRLQGRGGSHGRPWEYKVIVRQKEHPITRGLPTEFLQVKEELYDRMRGPAINMEVLATAFAKGGSERHEPVLMTITYGKGRIFHTVMGHSHTSMGGVAFQETLIRGTEWAATGKVMLLP